MKYLLTLLVIFSLWNLVSPAAFTQEKGNPLDKAPDKYAKFKEMKIHYKDLGKGSSALVLVHGWTGNVDLWRDQVPALVGKMRVIVVDLPGHGKSSAPKVEYTMKLFAQAVDAVLQGAGVEKAVLAGHSMGTPVVREYYRLYPKKTLGLIAVDGALRALITDKEQIKKFVGMFDGPNYKELAQKFLSGMLTDSTPKSARKLISDSTLNTPQHVASSAMKNMWLDEAIWKSDEIKVPLLLIHAKTPFWNEDYMKYVKKLAPQAEIHTMEGVGHFLFLERPKEFNELMLAFLKKHQFLSK